MLDFRENPTFAAFPAALCSVFSLRRYVTALLFLNRRIHSFRVCLSAYWGQKRKLRFPFLQVVILTINCAFQNRYFGLAHSICRTLATSAGEVARFNNMRALNYRATRAAPSNSQKIATVSSARFSRAEYLLAQAKPRFCVSAPLFANTFAFAGKVNAARIVWCALKGRAAEENSKRRCRLQSGSRWGCPLSLDFLFRQLETKSEKEITYPFPRRPAERRP